MVRRDRFKKPAVPHGHKRCAIHQAVALVRSAFVEAQSLEELLSTHGQHIYAGVSQAVAHQPYGCEPGTLSGSTKKREDFSEHRVRGNKARLTKLLRQSDGAWVQVVIGIEQRDPIGRVRESLSSHSTLGRPYR